MSIGVTGVSIAPELGLHFHKGSLSFFERCCCCASPEPSKIMFDDQMYIDYKLRVMRWQDRKTMHGFDSTHARLKLIVVDRLHKISSSPFEDAQKAFEMSGVSWSSPVAILASDLSRMSTAISSIKESILEMPFSD